MRRVCITQRCGFIVGESPFIDAPQRVLVSTAICILDFGGAITNGQASQKKTLFCGKMYRAPEAVLGGPSYIQGFLASRSDLYIGLPWSHGVDTYAVGCVIAELYLTGNLFYPEIASDREHLALIERILGPFPLDFASTVEAMYPGTFRFDHSPTVIFPPGGITFAGEQYARPMQRILDAQPISVCRIRILAFRYCPLMDRFVAL